MKIITIRDRKVVNPANLLDFNYEIDMYVGCEHQCKYCYVQNDFEFKWDEEIGIYDNLGQKLVDEIVDIEPQNVYIGMDTDPYQPVEEKLRQTRIVLEILKDKGFSVCILTKSDLVLRDIDLIKGMPGSSVGFSIAFQDESDRIKFEENTVFIKRRLDALKELNNVGVTNYCLINPVMPFITDVFSLINKMKDFTDTFWIYRLNFISKKSINWQKIIDVLNKHYPSKKALFTEIVFNPEHKYWSELKEKLQSLSKGTDLNLEIHL